jgi:hypothetical protein
VTVALRYVLLAVGAVSVLGVSVYLALEVRGRPAQAQAPAPVPAQAPERAAAARGAKEAAIDAEEDLRPQPSRATPARTEPASRVREPPRGPDGAPEDPAPQKLDAMMNEANKAYDHSEWDEAKAIARKVLRTSPNNVRMLRIIVSASCITGDNADAQAAYAQLPAPDREQMKTRCARYGVSFTEP